MTGPADVTLDLGGQKGPKLVQNFPALCSCPPPDFGLPSLTPSIPLNRNNHPKLSTIPFKLSHPKQVKKDTLKKAIKDLQARLSSQRSRKDPVNKL